MSYTKCAYHKCNNTSLDISMFRFPVHDEDRLMLWIRNSGNVNLDILTNEKLRCRYICAAHFQPDNIHKGMQRSRLIGPAVPVHFESVEVGKGTSSQTGAHVDTTDMFSSTEQLKVKVPTKCYARRKRTSASQENDSVITSPTMFESYVLLA